MDRVKTFLGTKSLALPFPGHRRSNGKECQGKEFEMRDEIDARLWVDHHEAFSRDLDRALAALRLRVGRLWQWDGTSAHLIALIASFAITGLSFNATVA